MLKSILIAVLLFFIAEINGQENTDEVLTDAQFWLDYNGKHSMNEQKSISGFIGYRTINPHLYDMLLLVPTYNIIHTKSPEFMNRKKKPLIHSFHLGSGIYYTNNYDFADNFEFRLSEGVAFFLPSHKTIPLKNLIRFEQRFQKTFDGSNWNTSLRFRYKISTVIEWKKHLFSFNKGMYIPLSVEVFFNLKEADRFNDVIRITPGIGYKFNDEWKAEFLVSYHYANNTSATEDSSNDFVFRLRLFKTNIKKAAIMDTKEEEIKELIE